MNKRILAFLVIGMAPLAFTNAYAVTADDVECNKCVDRDDIASNAVTTPKLVNGAVTAFKIRNVAVTTPKIRNLAVTTAKINTGAVTTPKLVDGAVITDKLRDASVSEDKIKNFSVSTGKIQAGAVTYGKLSPEIKAVLAAVRIQMEEQLVIIANLQLTVAAHELAIQDLQNANLAGAGVMQYLSKTSITDAATGEEYPTIRVTGANLQVVNGYDSNGAGQNGTGNLIMGYQQSLDKEGGAHQLIVAE